MSRQTSWKRALFSAIALGALAFVGLAACGGAAYDGSGDEAADDADIRTGDIVVQCLAGERRFTVSKAGAKLEGRFKNFKALDPKTQKYECEPRDRGTIRYRCWRDVGERLAEQVNVMRNAFGTPQTEFNLVNVRNEQGGGDILFSFACDKGSKLDF